MSESDKQFKQIKDMLNEVKEIIESSNKNINTAVELFSNMSLDNRFKKIETDISVIIERLAEEKIYLD